MAILDWPGSNSKFIFSLCVQKCESCQHSHLCRCSGRASHKHSRICMMDDTSNLTSCRKKRCHKSCMGCKSSRVSIGCRRFLISNSEIKYFPTTYIVSGDVGGSLIRTVVAASCLCVKRMTNILMSQRIRITEPFYKCYGQNLPNFTMIKWENSFKILNLNCNSWIFHNFNICWLLEPGTSKIIRFFNSTFIASCCRNEF